MHFDQYGDDTLDKVDLGYLTAVARVGATVVAKLTVVDGK